MRSLDDVPFWSNLYLRSVRSSPVRMKNHIENIKILRLPNFYIWEPREACKYWFFQPNIVFNLHFWCVWRDLNPHASPHENLNLACLPIPSQTPTCSAIYYTLSAASCKGNFSFSFFCFCFFLTDFLCWFCWHACIFFSPWYSPYVVIILHWRDSCLLSVFTGAVHFFFAWPSSIWPPALSWNAYESSASNSLCGGVSVLWFTIRRRDYLIACKAPLIPFTMASAV